MNRRLFLRWAAGLMLAGMGGGAYATAIEPGFRLEVRRWRLRPPGWPQGYGLRIAALADLHAGAPHMGRGRVREIVARANGLGADLIVLLGDYAAGHRFVWRKPSPREIAADLGRLRAPLGVWAVLGNHDWWDDRAAQMQGSGPTETHRAFAAAGIAVLENDAVRLSHGGGAFWLAGLGDQLAFPPRWRRRMGAAPRRFGPALAPEMGMDDLPGTLAKLSDDAPAVLLAHEPDVFPHVPERVALTLSGHTHGGQVRLFGWSPVVPSRYGDRYAYGPVTEGGRCLAVSGGLGCSVAPVRLGVPPEINLIELG